MSMIVDPVRFERAIALFDAANAEDPNQDEGQPKELLYARRMTDMIGRYAPDAGEAAQLAVRAQHIKRWTVPRNSQPMTKEGYHAWRTGLYKFHAETAGELMRQAGYDQEMIDRVMMAVGKRQLKLNADTQMMEDVTDLVFHRTLPARLSPASTRTTARRSGWKSSARPGKRCRIAPTPSPPAAVSNCRSPWYH
jgi:hypothetical protein